MRGTIRTEFGDVKSLGYLEVSDLNNYLLNKIDRERRGVVLSTIVWKLPEGVIITKTAINNRICNNDYSGKDVLIKGFLV